MPTVKELGYPQFIADSRISLFGPPGLDPAISARLNVLIAKTLANPEIAKKIRGLGSEVAFADGPGAGTAGDHRPGHLCADHPEGGVEVRMTPAIQQ